MSLRDRARQAAEVEAARAERERQRKLEQIKREAEATLVPQAVARVREVLGEQTSPAAWQFVHVHHDARRVDGDYIEAWDDFLVTTVLEGMEITYKDGKLKDWRNLPIDSLVDFYARLSDFDAFRKDR